MSRIAVVMVNFRNAEDTMACLDSLASAGAGAEEMGVILVENGSGDGSAGKLRAYAAESALDLDLRVSEVNLGFAAGTNLGIDVARERGAGHVVILNNDTLVDADFPARVRAAIAREPEAVIAGFIANLESGTPSHNLGKIGPWTTLVRYHFHGRREPLPPFDFISGCLMIVPTAVFRSLGDLRSDFFLYCEDLEFCMRLKAAGIPLRYDPDIGIRHRVSSSVTRTSFPKEYYRMRNQTYLALRRPGLLPKAIYLARVALVLARRCGDSSLFRQFTAGFRDGAAGRLGHNPGMRA
jgi:GT2 family glycosyltransferase